MLNNLMTHYLEKKKIHEILLQINSSYFGKMVYIIVEIKLEFQ